MQPADECSRISIAELNAMDAPAFAEALAGLVEHAPWVLEAAAAARPFDGAEAMLAAIAAVIAEAPRERRIALLKGHPELAGAEARAGAMTSASTDEQGRLGLTGPGSAEAARLAELNARYRAAFGFPCVIALRRHRDLASVLAAFESRLGNSPETELSVALAEVAEVVRGRIAARIRADGALA